MEEIEIKFLDINPQEIEERLERIGAKKVNDFFYRRRIFDTADLSFDKKGAWIRLRDEGDKITLGFKQRLGITSHDGSTNDESMEEIEFKVDDFDQAGKFMEKIGFTEKFYQENKRTRWVKDDMVFDIDYWPKLNPYLEIEASGWERIDEAVKLLGLNNEDKKIFTNFQIYQQQGIDLRDYQRITFEDLVLKIK